MDQAPSQNNNSVTGNHIEIVYFLIAFIVCGMICLWGALCILSIGGWFFHRRDSLAKRDVQELPPEFDAPGLTWRDPVYWVFAFFCWPVLVALSLDAWYCRQYGESET